MFLVLARGKLDFILKLFLGKRTACQIFITTTQHLETGTVFNTSLYLLQPEVMFPILQLPSHFWFQEESIILDALAEKM